MSQPRIPWKRDVIFGLFTKNKISWYLPSTKKYNPRLPNTAAIVAAKTTTKQQQKQDNYIFYNN